MSWETAFALIGFAFVMSISPGPANFLLLASGVNFGFTRSLPLVFGISLGFLSMVLLVGLGLGRLLQTVPILYTAIKIVCAGYVLYLAWKIARSRSIGPDGQPTIEKPMSFFHAAILQLVNPKAWVVAVIVTVAYTDPGNPLTSLIAIIGLFALVNLPSISVWAVSGAAFRRLIGNGRVVVFVNIALALLLVGSMIPVLLSSFDGPMFVP